MGSGRRAEQPLVFSTKNQYKDGVAVATRPELNPACVLLADQDEEWNDGQVVTGVLYKAQDGAERVAHASLTVVCDGMYSSLRRKLSTPNIQHPSYFVGLLLQGCALPHANYGHVVLGTPSPILFYPISSCEVGSFGFEIYMTGLIWECRQAGLALLGVLSVELSLRLCCGCTPSPADD